MAAKYAIEKSCGMSAEVDLSSEFRYRFGENTRKMNPNFSGVKRDLRVNKSTLVILISQSGETADTIAALREVKKIRCENTFDCKRSRIYHSQRI